MFSCCRHLSVCVSRFLRATGHVFMLEVFYFSWILIAVFSMHCSSEKEWFFFFWNNCNICKNTVGYSWPTMQQKIKFLSGIPYFCRQEWSLSLLEVKLSVPLKKKSRIMSFPCLHATVYIFLQGSFPPKKNVTTCCVPSTVSELLEP